MTLASWNYCPGGGKAVDTLGPMDYVESKESGNTGLSQGASQAQRIFYVAWPSVPAFYEDLTGYSFLDGSNNVKRILPDPHPTIDNFYCVDATAQGVAFNGKYVGLPYISFKAAKVTANYKPVPYAVLGDGAISTELDRYVTRTFGFATENMQVNKGAEFKWVTAKDGVVGGASKAIGTMELTIVWHEVPADSTYPFQVPLLSTIQNSLGKVNSTAFDTNSPVGGYDVGTVVFQGVEPKLEVPKINTVNSYFWEMTYKFGVRNNGLDSFGDVAGWNHLYDARSTTSAGRWDMITSGPDASKPPPLGFPIYASADLNLLFKWS